MKETVVGIGGAWINVTPKKGTKYVRLLCETHEDERKLYHTLWLTEKTEENSIKSLIKYGFNGEIEDIWASEDGSEAARLFDVPEGGVEVEVETETYTDKATGEEKSIDKIAYVVGCKNSIKKMDKSLLPNFKSSTTILRKYRAEAEGNAPVKSFEE